jgi:hypothetical protein
LTTAFGASGIAATVIEYSASIVELRQLVQSTVGTTGLLIHGINSTDAAGGAVGIFGGSPAATFNGGEVTIAGAPGGAGGGIGGQVILTGGTGSSGAAPGATLRVSGGDYGVPGQGGFLELTAGSGGTTVGDPGGDILLVSGVGGTNGGPGGTVKIYAGAGRGASDGGGIELTAGAGDPFGAGSGDGGDITILAGYGATFANTNGGDITVITGQGNGTGDGGQLILSTGTSGSGATGAGGAIFITASSSSATDGNGGPISITAGDATGTGNGGSIILTPGTTVGGNLGIVQIIGDGAEIRFDQVSAIPVTPGASKGAIWVKDTSPTTLIYTDSAGTDFDLANGTTTVISPAQITANTNNYNPTGFATAHVVRLDTDASRNLTGLDAAATVVRKLLINVGANPLVLTHQDANSSAANRFLIPGGGNLTLQGDDSATIYYDAVTTRWRIV